MNRKQLALAGKELLKGNFGNAIKSLSVDVNPSLYGQKDPVTGDFFYPFGVSTNHFSYADRASCIEAFRKCPPLAAVIRKKAQAHINGRVWVLNSKGKESDSPDAKRIKRLLSNPNYLQSWKQFNAQGKMYEQIFGFNVILVIKPSGFSDMVDASALWNIPPNMLTIEESTTNFFSQTSIKGAINSINLTYKGFTTSLNLDDLIIIKDITPSAENLLFPVSRISELEMSINNIIGTLESRNVLINYRGALGIFSKDNAGGGELGNLPVTKAEKEDLQRDFQRYGLKRSQWQFIITSAALKWQSVGVPTKDLMLFEEMEDDIMRICDSYGFPYQLMASGKGTTFSNVKEAKQLLYQDTTIPEAETWYEQLSNGFNLERYNLRLDADFSGVSALQENRKEKAEARKVMGEALINEFKSNLITYNRVLELMEEDPRPGFDKYYYELAAEGIYSLPGSDNNDNENGTSQDNGSQASTN